MRNAPPAIRVVIASRLYLPEVTAASFRIAALAGALARTGDVEVLTTEPPKAAESARSADAVDKRVRVFRARVLRDRSGAIRGYFQYASFDVPLLFRLLLRRRADVYIAEAPPTTGLVALFIARCRRARLVYYPGDVWTHGVISMGAARPVVAVMRWVESRVVRGADLVLAVSPEVRDRLADLGAEPAQIVTVGNGIDTAIFRPDLLPTETGRPYFVYTGTMSEWQQPQVFVRALAAVDDAVDIRFFGQGSVEAELRRLAEEIAPGRVHFGGTVDPTESARWIRGAVASLVSIVPGIGYDFARPTKTYAAAACGTPVIFAGAETGGEIVRSAGLGAVASFDEDEVASAMRLLLAQAADGTTDRLRPERADWAIRNVSLDAVAARAAAVVESLVSVDR